MTAGWVSPGNRDLVRTNSTWIVLLFAVAASITSITNGFAFDDVKIILENGSVHSLERFWRFFNETLICRRPCVIARPLSMLLDRWRQARVQVRDFLISRWTS